MIDDHSTPGDYRCFIRQFGILLADDWTNARAAELLQGLSRQTVHLIAVEVVTVRLAKGLPTPVIEAVEADMLKGLECE